MNFTAAIETILEFENQDTSETYNDMLEAVIENSTNNPRVCSELAHFIAYDYFSNVTSDKSKVEYTQTTTPNLKVGMTLFDGWDERNYKIVAIFNKYAYAVYRKRLYKVGEYQITKVAYNNSSDHVHSDDIIEYFASKLYPLVGGMNCANWIIKKY